MISPKEMKVGRSDLTQRNEGREDLAQRNEGREE